MRKVILGVSIGLLGCLSVAFADEADKLRDLNTHCPFTPPQSKEQWAARADALRLQLESSLGLYPVPLLDPVEPAIYGKVLADGYSVEKVTFESLPGLFVTGNLYRPDPATADTQVPAVLCPHGHWEDARFYEASEAEVKRLLSIGAERFENAARNHIQARCVQLARMGCIVFHWDMLGYCDSTQISMDRAHRFARQESAAEVQEDGWLLFSPLAEAHGQSIMGLQALATRRAVDMLLTLPEVDPLRIAITGASGGGTQSFLGAAIDQRIRVAFPAVMVSTGMQGGCTCENACGLRVGTGNVEMAGLIAPRPLGLTAADDWTKTMPEDGFPQLRQLYRLFDAEDQVALFPAVHFGHNFNHVSRTAMYGWINRHFQLGLEMPVLERDFEPMQRAQLTVWDAEHPQPPGGVDFERGLMKLWAGIRRAQLLGLARGDQQQQATLLEVLQRGWAATLGLTALKPSELTVDEQADQFQMSTDELGQWSLRTEQIASGKANDRFGSTQAEEVPHHHDLLDLWHPQADELHIEVVQGDQTRRYFPYLAGRVVADKSDAEGQPMVLETVKQRLVENPRLAACYTYGYNAPLFARRAQQLGKSLQWLAEQHPSAIIRLRGRSSDAALAAAGLFCAQAWGFKSTESECHLVLDPAEFRFDGVTDIRDPNFLPNSASYLGLPGLLVSLRDTHIDLAGSADGPVQSALERLYAPRGNQLTTSHGTQVQ